MTLSPETPLPISSEDTRCHVCSRLLEREDTVHEYECCSRIVKAHRGSCTEAWFNRIKNMLKGPGF